MDLLAAFATGAATTLVCLLASLRPAPPQPPGPCPGRVRSAAEAARTYRWREDLHRYDSDEQTSEEHTSSPQHQQEPTEGGVDALWRIIRDPKE